MLFNLFLLIVAAFIVWTAYRNAWDFKATVAALGATAATVWAWVEGLF